MSENIITGLDIGSGTIRIAVGQTGSEGELQILGIAETPSQGVGKGMITDLEDTVSSISQALDKIERLVGLSINHAYIGISGTHIISQVARGIVAVSRADGEIRKDDVVRVLEAAQSVATPPNYEILHIIPRSFTVDNQPNIKDPIGMTGVRIEVDAQIILGLTSQIKNLRKCLYRAGITDDELVFVPLASAEAVLTKRQKELGVAVVDIGETTTSLAVFEEGNLLLTKTLPIGSRYVTSDIAIGLRIPLDLAEKIKINYGSACSNLVNKHEMINLKDLSDKEEGVISRREIAEIIEARCEEIYKMVNKELETIDRSGKLPAGVILTGGGAKLPGLVELAKKIFKLPASIGIPSNFNSQTDKIFDPSYSTVLGLVFWGKKMHILPKRSLLKLIKSDWLKKIFKNLLP
ncbi:MAG: cell division protein FtsA [Patescibacteria group bacterium]